jgi:two-component system cell cycle sensor histidine kinase PleC
VKQIRPTAAIPPAQPRGAARTSTVVVKKPAGTENAGGAAQSSLLALVMLLLIAFAGGLYVQIDAQSRQAEQAALRLEALEAERGAEQVHAGVIHAWGALAGAADFARSSGQISANPGAAVAAAARARPVLAVGAIGPGGAVLASTRQNMAALYSAAVKTAGNQAAWAGVARAENTPPTPALTRRVGDVVLVSLLDPAELAPQPHAGATIVLTDTDGVVITASGAVAVKPGANAGDAFGAPDSAIDRTAFVGADANGEATPIGAANVRTGGLRVYSVGASGYGADATWRGLLQFLMLAAGPLMAVGCLLVLLRQNAQRAVQLEAQVERAEERFRLAADGARAGVFEWRPSLDEINLSTSLMALIHAPSETMRLHTLVSLAQPEERHAIETAFRQAIDTGALDVTFRVASAHAVTWIEMRGVAIAEANAPESTRIVGAAVDITAKREAEMRAGALEKRLREAIDSFTGPFALWDKRRRLLIWNRSYVRLFRLDPTSLRSGMTYETIAMAAAPAIKRERADATDPQAREMELADGSWLRIVERRTGDGGLVSVGFDITAQKTKEDELVHSREDLLQTVARLERSEGKNKELARKYDEEKKRAEQANKAKSVFLANMSHELRTPLNAINGFSEMIWNQMLGPVGHEKYIEYAKDIHGSGLLLLDLINDILDMAKIEAGKLSLSPRTVDPLDIVDNAQRLVRRRADEKGLQLIIDAHECPEIEADPRALKQMLLNLLSNAVKFTEKGGVMVEVRPATRGVTFRIIDTGRGIPAEHLPRLARPFEQVETQLTRTQQGTGLGLSLTKSLTEMHGGSFQIESEVGKGTVVTITLPLRFGGDAEEKPPAIAAE